MIYLKLNALILDKEKIKENSAIVYILTKNNGVIKCYLKGLFRPKSKNLSLMEPGNFNRLFILTNLEQFRIISCLPLKIASKAFRKDPYTFLWLLKIIKTSKILSVSDFTWFILTHLDNYLPQNPKNFPYWFLFHFLKELGYGLELKKCNSCNRGLKNFAYFDNKRSLFCSFCRKSSWQLITKKDLTSAQKIQHLIKIPKFVPRFLKIALRNVFRQSMV